MNDAIRITLFDYVLRLKTPLRLARTQLHERRGLLLRLSRGDRALAWSEAAPLPGFSSESLEAVIAEAKSKLHSLNGLSAEEAVDALNRLPVGAVSLHFALQTLARRLAASSEKPTQQIQTPASEKLTPLCALLAGSDAEKLKRLESALRAGCQSFKLKVGFGNESAELALVREARKRMGPHCRLRLDANRAWNGEEALRRLDAFGPYDIEYIEEPLANPCGLGKLHTRTGIPLAADETLQELSAATMGAPDNQHSQGTSLLREIIEQAQILVWKPTLSLAPEQLSIKTTAPVVLSACFESGVGTAAVLERAAERGDERHAAGVDTYDWLAEDVLVETLTLDYPRTSSERAATCAKDVNLSVLRELSHD